MDSVEELKKRASERKRPFVRLSPSPSVSRSCFGGAPSLTEGMEWPRWNGTPLAFLAQLDLAEASHHVAQEWMPSDGRLLFFYDAAQSTWGFDPADRGSWAVFYTSSPEAGASPIPEDAPEFDVLAGEYLTLSLEHALPSWDRLGGHALSLDPDASEDLWEWYENQDQFEGPDHRVFGWPNPVQGDDMELECQLASNGIYCGGRHPEEQRSEIERLKPDATDWELLLQMDSSDIAMWGDTGMLYFWVRRQDARRGDFSNVWMVLQCC